MTQREYIWLDDLPVAVVDQVASAPVIYYVHTDHLFRPVAMTNASQGIAWSVIYQPFGEVAAINAQNTTMDLRFPGQWFQLETGLHYNWHRHYDATTGRYLQPDPLIVDDGAASVGGLSTVLTGTTSSVSNGALIAGTLGSIAPQAFVPRASARALLPDGPSVYGYARQSPLTKFDPFGLTDRSLSQAIGGMFESIYDHLCPCPACTPYPAGTIGWIRLDTTHDHYPINGAHLHLRQVNQRKSDCKCFWNDANPDVASPPPQPDWVDLTGGEPPLTP